MNEDREVPPIGVGSLFPAPGLETFLKDFLKKNEEEQLWYGLTAMFNQDKHENFPKARSVILDYHLQLDGLMNRTIMLLCILGSRSTFVIDVDKFLDTISHFEFGRKIALMSSMQACSSASLEIINRINTIRNAFAHQKTDDKAFIYSGESIFLLKGIQGVQKDYFSVVDEFYKQFEKLISK